MAEKSIILKSEVIGLDLLLRGGFQLPPPVNQNEEEQLGLVLLIRGKPGTGKTTLALQIFDTSLHWDMPANLITKYYSLDQAKNDIDDKLKKIRREKQKK